MRVLQISKTASLFLLAFFFVIACDQSSNSFSSDENTNETTSLNKGNTGKGKGNDQGFGNTFSASKDFSYSDSLGGYKGGTLQINFGSNFHVYNNSLTPPKKIKWGKAVTITMDIEYDLISNEMVFSFGPSGSKFSPAARIKLDYSLIAQGNDVPNLYYITRNGDYIEQSPDKVIKGQNFMYLYVDHFSRYAVAYGR